MERLFNSDSALIVVDFQNDFAMPTGSLYVRGAEKTIPVIAQLTDAARAAGSVIVYTRDWHPARTPHFMSSGGEWPPHCVAKTWGAEFHADLPVASPAVHVLKGTGMEDGYSAFTVLDPVEHTSRATGLDALLRRLDVRSVVLAGLATDYCVKHTAIDAVRLGYRTLVVADAVRAVDARPGDGDRALEELAELGVEVVRELVMRRPGSEPVEDGDHA